MSSRAAKERDAISKANQLNESWEEAVNVSTETAKASPMDYDCILPAKADDTSLDVVTPERTPYDPVHVSSPTVIEGRVQGREIQYYSTEQANQNLLLKASVAENEELLMTLHELQSEQVANARQLLATRNRNRGEKVREFDEGYKWPEPSGYSAVSLVDEFGLSLTIPTINELGEIEHPTIGNAVQLLEELLKAKCGQAKRQAVEKEITTVCEAYITPVTTQPRVPPIIMQLHDLVHTDVFSYIKGELARNGSKLKVLLDELEAAETGREEALAAEDIPLADEYHRKSVSLLEKLIACVRERLSQIMMGSSDTGNFRGKFEHFRKESTVQLNDVRKSKEGLKSMIINDLDTLAQKGEEAAASNDTARKDYASYIKNSNEKLNGNAKRQDELWEKIQDMVEEIKILGEQRAIEVNEHLRRTEDEEKRKREYDEFSEVFAEHCRRLEDLLKNTDTALQLLDSVDEFFSLGCNLVEAKRVEEELGDIRITEMKRYLEFYRKYVLVAGDLILKRKARLKGVKRSKRNCETQLALCRDALDPNRVKYAEELRQLNSAQAEVEAKLAEMERKFEEQYQDFAPTEEALEDAGVDFVPPRLEHDDMQTSKRSRLLQVTKQFVADEQDEVDQEVTAIRKLTADTRIKKEDVVKKRDIKRETRTRDITAADRPMSAPAASLSH